MTTDHITAAQKAASNFAPGFWDHRGWGFGLAIVTGRAELSDVPGRFGWDGGYGTSCYVDPAETILPGGSNFNIIRDTTSADRNNF